MMAKRQIGLMAAGLCALMLIFTVLMGSAQSQEEKLKTYLEDHQATPQQREAYFFAVQHPEVLKFIPCYCGCARFGHKSNYNCFVQGDPKIARKEPFDQHGFICPMCLQIALNAKAMSEAGVPLSEIRRQIDEAYAKHPNLHATDTPKPAEKAAP